MSEAGLCLLAGPLDERVRFEALMADLSAAFVNLPPDGVDDGIDNALQRVVEFLAVERSSFAEVSEDGRVIRLSHSYVAPGFPAFPPSILDDQLPWFAGMIRQGNTLKLERLPEDLPPQAELERSYCVRAGLLSQLTIPLRIVGSVQYAIGCASFRRQRDWPDELILRLRMLGEVFANALARRRTDEELRRREHRYRDLVEATRAVPWEADPEVHQTHYISPRIVNLLGYPQDAWYRPGFWVSCLHHDDRGPVLRGIREAVRTGRDHEIEYRMAAADGRTVWVHDLITARSDDGRPTVLHGVMIDITVRKRVEDEAARLREQLASTSRVATLGELAAAIAHEVNQPLCAIVSNAETLLDYIAGNTADVAEVQDALQDIVADGRRASEIIRRIRAVLRTRQAEQAPFDLNGAIHEVVRLLSHRLVRDGIAAATDFAGDLPPVFGDRVQVQQVIFNLMVNAAEAFAGCPVNRRRLTISTASDGGSVTVTVGDTGPGIGPECLDRVFDAFYTTKSEGTGVGLSISRRIAEAHGGRLWAESAIGGGAAFHFTLPTIARPIP